MYYIHKEGENIYLSAWEYNAALIFARVREIITENGGRVKPVKAATIHAGSYYDAIRENNMKIERLEQATGEKNAEKRAAVIAALKKENAQLENEKPAPVVAPCAAYISAIIGGEYISMQFDSNPFFPFYYIKTPVTGGTYSGDACLEDLPHELFDLDNMWHRGATAAQREQAAQNIYAWIISAPRSVVRRDSHRRRVSNTYNNGYHYETIFEKERRSAIDF